MITHARRLFPGSDPDSDRRVMQEGTGLLDASDSPLAASNWSVAKRAVGLGAVVLAASGFVALVSSGDRGAALEVNTRRVRQKTHVIFLYFILEGGNSTYTGRGEGGRLTRRCPNRRANSTEPSCLSHALHVVQVRAIKLQSSPNRFSFEFDYPPRPTLSTHPST